MKYIAMFQTQRGAGICLILISALSFGMLPIFTRFAYLDGATPATVLFLRFSSASALMLILMMMQRKRLPRGRLLLSLFLLGGIGYVGETLAYFTALTLAPASLVELLVYLYPALVCLLSVLFLKERLTLLKGSAIALALLGTALTIGPIRGGYGPGILFGLISALSYAVYLLIAGRVAQETDAITLSTTIMTSAALVYGGISIAQGPALPHSLQGWGAIAALALVSTVLGFITLFGGLKKLGTTNAAIFSTGEPIVTVVFSMLLLGERVNLLQIGGGVLILVAVLALAKAERK